MSEILVDRRDKVAIMTLNRPESLNALTQPMTALMGEQLQDLNDDPDVRALVITGAGRGFCSGLDLKERDPRSGKWRSPYRMLNFNDHSIGRIRPFAKPTIAAVNGVAVGGGLGIALACDIRIAGRSARFCASFVKVGLPPQDAVAAFLPQAVGLSKALEMIYTAKMVGSDEAQSIGLVSAVAEDDALLDHAMELAARIAQGPPVALAMAKQVVYRSFGKHLDDQLALQNLGTFLNSAYAPEDINEALTAFAERRAPEFSGK